MTKHYQVLARKYRPKNFNELLGQSHVSVALSNAIDTGRLHHAYLFTGTRGVGKTTIARILAKCLNCETGVTSTPCGVCASCQAIDAGQFLDLIEIDAASRTKVEDTRELLDNVPYAPVQGRYKVYLIDEVHMLSTHSFNALLKTLEEPPSHVKFLFATTDPQKLPVTIISRCLQFVLRPLPQSLLVEHLDYVLKSEQITAEPAALWQLANAAKGSVRDALSLTDQAIAFGGTMITVDTVNHMLGLVNHTDIVALFEAIYQNDKQCVADEIGLMRSKMVDAAQIFDELIDAVYQMALMQVLPNSPLDINQEQAKRLQSLAALIPATQLQLYYEILLKSRESLRLVGMPMQALEMAILRLLAFRPLPSDEYLSDMQAKQSGEQAVNKPLELDLSHQQMDDANKSYHANGELAQSELAQSELAQSELAQSELAQSELAQSELAQSELNENDLHNYNQDYHEYEATNQQLAIDTKYDNTNPNNAAVNDKNNSQAVSLSLDYGDLLNQEDYDNYLGSNNLPHDPLNAHHNHNDRLDDINYQHNHQAPIVFQQTANHQDNASHLVADDHHNLDSGDIQTLLSPPVCDLTGVWTLDKWDYWSYQAYHEGLLTSDEFALAQSAVIEGEIAGNSHLLVDDIHHQIEYSFAHLKTKMQQALGSLVSLNKSDTPLVQTPYARQQARKAAVIKKTHDNLACSPVVQKLAEAGLLIDATQPIVQTKLLG